MDFRSNEADRIASNSPIRRCPSNRISKRSHAPFLVAAALMRGSWSFDMDYAKPADVVASMIDAGLKKLALPHATFSFAARFPVRCWVPPPALPLAAPLQRASR